MGYDISYENYRLGSGVVYNGKRRNTVTKKDIAVNRVRYLQMKVATTTGKEKEKWVQELKIKDKILQSKAHKLTTQLTTFRYKKKKEYANILKFKDDKAMARISKLNGTIEKVKKDLIHLKAEDILRHDKSLSKSGAINHPE